MSIDNRSAEVKAGLLVFIGLVIFFGFLFLIADFGLKTEQKKFVSRFSYSNGIQPGSLVRLGGLLVGKIDLVYFPTDDPTKIEVVLSVDKDAPVKNNSEAFITSIGIMSDYYVEITPGTADSPMLEDGAFLNSRDVPSLVQLGAKLAVPVERITAQVEDMLQNLNRTLLSEENTVHFTNMLASVDTILKSSQNNAIDITTNLVSLTQRLDSLTARLDLMMAENADNLSGALVQFNSSMAHAESLIVALAKTTSQLNYVISSNEMSFHAVLENLNTATDNFQAFSRKVKEQPWSLIRKSPLPKREIPKNQ